ncbi:MAG: hypothetical protein Q9192_008554 [Flavoplaca navasiana]
MGVPFEALLPGVIIMGLMGITGAGMSTIRAMQNGGKRGRHSVDQWDRQAVMERDRRLTGMLRGQTDNPRAPPGFELNNPWKVTMVPSSVTGKVIDSVTVGGSLLLNTYLQTQRTDKATTISKSKTAPHPFNSVTKPLIPLLSSAVNTTPNHSLKTLTLSSSLPQHLLSTVSFPTFLFASPLNIVKLPTNLSFSITIFAIKIACVKMLVRL